MHPPDAVGLLNLPNHQPGFQSAATALQREKATGRCPESSARDCAKTVTQGLLHRRNRQYGHRYARTGWVYRELPIKAVTPAGLVLREYREGIRAGTVCILTIDERVPRPLDAGIQLDAL